MGFLGFGDSIEASLWNRGFCCPPLLYPLLPPQALNPKPLKPYDPATPYINDNDPRLPPPNPSQAKGLQEHAAKAPRAKDLGWVCGVWFGFLGFGFGFRV